MKYDFYFLRGIPTKNLISCNVIFMEPIGDTKKKSFIEQIIKLMHQNTKALVSERNGSFQHYDAIVLLNRIIYIDYEPGLRAKPFYIKLSLCNQDFLAAAGYKFKA